MSRKRREMAPGEAFGKLPGESFLRYQKARSERLRVRTACRTQDFRRIHGGPRLRWVTH